MGLVRLKGQFHRDQHGERFERSVHQGFLKL